VAGAVEDWFRENARALPWRPTPVDGAREPYVSLVSELMLQQTQVSRVLEKFGPFLERFPTVESLAAAPEADVLAAWSGLGYYRRARLLHAAAKAVVDRHGGVFPDDPAALRALPGVGRYTAGAIASIVFGRREPILDGNVERVLLRLHGNDAPPKDKATQDWAWQEAARLVEESQSPGVLNEGLMELGATVCTPASPRCPACPLQTTCRAFAEGRTAEIPRPKPRAKQKDWFMACFVVEDGPRVLVETRGADGLWAGMVQPPTAEGAAAIDAPAAAERLGVRVLSETDRFVHVTTHRRVALSVFSAALVADRAGARWVTRDELAGLALSNAHRRVFGLTGS
jgi:A/G-specific adenine glycosylase